MGKNSLNAISNIQSVLEIWHIRNLTLECKMVVFKALTLFKIVHSCSTSVVPKQIIWRNWKYTEKFPLEPINSTEN